jgi:hypothetical protein
MNNISNSEEGQLPPELLNFSFVEGHPNLVRDERTNAILNTNYDEYKTYIELKKIKESETKRIESIESNITNLKDDLDEIKSLLRNLLK